MDNLDYESLYVERCRENNKLYNFTHKESSLYHLHTQVDFKQLVVYFKDLSKSDRKYKLVNGFGDLNSDDLSEELKGSSDASQRKLDIPTLDKLIEASDIKEYLV
jgi:hypothetical protein